MSICEVYLDAMDGFSFVFLFCLKDQLFENGIGTCDDADKEKGRQLRENGGRKKGNLIDNISVAVSCFLPRLTLSQ